MAPDELLDVVDDRGTPVGQASRTEVHENELLHRAVHAFLIDVRGRVLLQRRSNDKDVYPGMWTSSASGHVDAGEDPRDSVEREIEEELGLAVTGLRAVGKLRFDDPRANEHEITYVYVARIDGEPHPDPSELDELRLMDLDSLDQRVREDPAPFAPSMRHAWRLARRELL